MKIYIAGKMRGLENYQELFIEASDKLIEQGNVVINPIIFPSGLDKGDYTKISYAMIDICDGVYFLNNWKDSVGAKLEHAHALKTGKWIKYQE